MEDKILYHGSKGGLDGPIMPISRLRCDFGRGFYMGTNPEQAKSLVANDSAPMAYTLKLHLSEIPEEKICHLTDMAWCYVVLAHRKKVDAFTETKLARQIIEKVSTYDVVYGPIADDRMNEALRRFEEGVMTDRGLLACIRSVDYGVQYVAKTRYACEKIEILSERDIDFPEAEELKEYAEMKRRESRNVVHEMTIKYRRDGCYLDEIIKKAPSLEEVWER